ncbi:unnamed protein product [Blepharisma stoltei]|uniref:Caffeoyl-CoA O-methyltransferase n=1 Tax=Blepharisma stoltei TaxID=1481888 RepID=A0AAU9IE61_9CILI|nr:unnamed protein product [Blepharisma stoltei]
MYNFLSGAKRSSIFKGFSRFSGSLPVKTSLTQKSIEYIYRVGIRNNEIKEDLLSETRRIHPDDAIMSTDRIQGDFMENPVQSMNAKKCIEIGVFTGFSSLCTALGLPDDGKIFALDISEEFTSIAKKYWKLAGIDHKIDLVIAPALDTIARLRREGHENTFDFAFLDGDKENYLHYYENLLPLMRKGGMILVDNVAFLNLAADNTQNDGEAVGVRQLNERIGRDDRVKSIALPFGDGIFMVTKNRLF